MRNCAVVLYAPVMLKLTLLLIVSFSTFAQMPAKKSRIDGTKGTVTVQATPVISDAGNWQTKLWLSSPNTDTFKVCFRYFDGTTTRSLIKVATADPGKPALMLLELPLEVIESGSLYVYEMLPITVGEFEAR